MKFMNIILLATAALAIPVPGEDIPQDAANAAIKPTAEQIEEAAAKNGALIPHDQAQGIADAYNESKEAGDKAVAEAQGKDLPKDAANGLFWRYGWGNWWNGYYRYPYGGYGYPYGYGYGYPRYNGWWW